MGWHWRSPPLKLSNAGTRAGNFEKNKGRVQSPTFSSSPTRSAASAPTPPLPQSATQTAGTQARRLRLARQTGLGSSPKASKHSHISSCHQPPRSGRSSPSAALVTTRIGSINCPIVEVRRGTPSLRGLATAVGVVHEGVFVHTAIVIVFASEISGILLDSRWNSRKMKADIQGLTEDRWKAAGFIMALSIASEFCSHWIAVKLGIG